MTDNTAITLVEWPTATMPIKVFCAIYKTKPGTIHSYICRGQWIEGREFCRVNGKSIHIILTGYDKWVLNQVPKTNIPVASNPTAPASSSISNSTGQKITATKPSRGRHRLLT